MTTLEALARAVRRAPWSRSANRALVDALIEYGIDRPMAAVIVASVARAAHVRMCVAGWREVPDRVRYQPIIAARALLRRHVLGPIASERRLSRDARRV